MLLAMARFFKIHGSLGSHPLPWRDRIVYLSVNLEVDRSRNRNISIALPLATKYSESKSSEEDIKTMCNKVVSMMCV